MLEHFIEQVVTPKKLKGQAKGMVITQNIEAAIRYHKAISRLLAARGNPFKALIAFSGEKLVDGVEYTVIGDPRPYDGGLTPTRWNLTVELADTRG